MTTKIECALDEIRRIADGAYCASLNKFSSTPCLGFEAKLERGLFGKTELDAHAEANRLMGRHFGMYEALRIFRDGSAVVSEAFMGCVGMKATTGDGHALTVTFADEASATRFHTFIAAQIASNTAEAL